MVCYILEQDRSRYADYTGTGNALNANHPIVRRMIVDRLRYWVREMHVDGSWHATHRAARCRTRRSCGTSNRTRSSPARS